jgi:hypothetical protein
VTTFRTPVPDDEYLRLLGRASYTWSYTEWAMLYIITWLTQDDLARHAGKTAGRIVNVFNEALDSATPPAGIGRHVWERARSTRDDLEIATHRRNDILHARPATAPGERQRLNRWAPGKPHVTGGFIEVPDLLDFIAMVEQAHAEISPLHGQLAR